MIALWILHALKRVLMAAGFAVVLLPAAPAQAWTEPYSWAPDPAATFYKIEKSVDNGVTWTVVTTALTTPAYTYTGTEAGLTLFRVSNCNAIGCTVRPADGMWHDESKRVPAAPLSIVGT